MERLHTMETQILAVTDALGQGQGAIHVKHEDTQQEAEARAETVLNYYENVPAGRPVGCIDGRDVLETIDGDVSELGPKTAGGSAISGLYARAMEGHISTITDAYSNLASVIDMLEEQGEAPARFHIDADNKDKVFSALEMARTEFSDVSSIDDFISAVITNEHIPAGTGCGMGDQFKGAVSCMARQPRTYKRGDQEITETTEEATMRLAFMRSSTQAISSDTFDDSVFDSQVENATAMVEAGALNEFNELKALIIADRVLLDAGVEGGVYKRLEVLGTSDEGVHGHDEDGVTIMKTKGKVFNVSRYFQETGDRYFSYEQWIKHPIAQTISTGIEDYESSVSRNAQAIDASNVAAYFQLSDGSPRIILAE